jgi:hypothetical protein
MRLATVGGQRIVRGDPRNSPLYREPSPARVVLGGIERGHLAAQGTVHEMQVAKAGALASHQSRLDVSERSRRGRIFLGLRFWWGAGTRQQRSSHRQQEQNPEHCYSSHCPTMTPT